MDMEIFDPTTKPVKQRIAFVSRPKDLNGLKIGLLENTKHNSDVLLLKIADRLKKKFKMRLGLLRGKKSASDYITEDIIIDFKNKVDFVIAGIGD